LYLEQPLDRATEVTIYAASGQVVSRKSIKKLDGTQTINVRQLKSGIYYLSIQVEGAASITQKFIKQ